MTNTSLKKNTWIFIGFLLLAGFMNLLTRTDKPVIDVIMACMHDIIFIGLLLFWQQSLRMRILVSKVREYMIWIAGWMLAYMLVRIFRYNIAQGIVVTRYFIYTYRVPQMMIPALFLMICIRIHRGEQPGRWNETLLLIPAVVLSVMVITNDLHNLIYRPSVELSQFVVATGTYTYGIGFYLLYVWMITITVAGLALLYREISRRPTGVIRGLIGIVIIWFAIILLNLLVLDRSLTHGYRMYGIPARYVSGYVLEPQLFEPSQTEEGMYKAEVSDYYAHAWVEIFLKDYGWVPVEVTPTDTGRMIASYPGYTSSTMYQIMREHGWSFRDDNSNDVMGNGGGGGTAIGKAVGTVFIILPVLVLIVLAVYIIIRKLYIKSHIGTMDSRKLFHIIMRGIHFAKILKNMNGSEKDFTEKLSEHITSLGKDELDRMIEAVQAENYSNEPVTKEERDHVEYCLRIIYPELYSKLILPKKPVFMLISPVSLKSEDSGNQESEESG